LGKFDGANKVAFLTSLVCLQLVETLHAGRGLEMRPGRILPAVFARTPYVMQSIGRSGYLKDCLTNETQ
jgi:hypothetical protein